MVYFKVSGDWLLLPALGSEAGHFLSLFHNKFISSFLSGFERRAISCTHIHRCALLIRNLIRLEDTQEEIYISQTLVTANVSVMAMSLNIIRKDY